MNQPVLLNSQVDFSNKVEFLLRRLHLNSEPCLSVYVLTRIYNQLPLDSKLWQKYHRLFQLAE